MKRLITVTAIALLCMGSVALGNEKKPAAFGALDAMTPAQARVKFAAWLKEIQKDDAANLEKLAAIWKDDQRTILDRVGDSLALGDANAAKLMAEARDPNAPAPVVLPAVFKDEKVSAFYRANFGLVYARSLTSRRVYEEALDVLKTFSASDVADPSAYLFHRAVCEHAMLRKAEASKTISRLLDEAAAISPERYRIVATLMLLDMHTWKEKDLADIGRKMENIERRLEIARGGPETQRQQKDVLNRLDELIKKMENANKNKEKKPGPPKPGDGPPKPGDGPPGSGDNGEECPSGGGKPMPGNTPGDPKGVEPGKEGAKDAKDAGGQSTGNVNPKDNFKKLVADWGRLPPREQERALQELTSTMNPRHAEAIRNYFRNLSDPALKK